MTKGAKITYKEIVRLNLEKHSNVQSLFFVEFEGYDLFQERVELTNELKSCFDFALEFREQYNMPFWDGFNLSLFNKNFSDHSFLSQIKHHNPKSEIYTVDSLDFFDFINNWPIDRYLTINSKVKMSNNQTRHFILLDFHIPVNKENQKICSEVMRCLNLTGYLLVSGKSYHFYGNELYSEEELLQVLSTSLLYSPIIDRAWIAHQLIEKSCCLRVTSKYGYHPYLVEEIN